MAIVTVDELKTLLGLSTTISAQESAVLTIVHSQAESKVKGHLGYDPEQATRTEYYPVRDLHGLRSRGSFLDVNASHTRAVLVNAALTEHLQLSHLPVRSVTSVNVDRGGRFGKASGAFPAGTGWTDGDDFWLEVDDGTNSRSGILIASGGWPVEPGSVKVVYVAGFTAAEFAGTSGIDASGIKRAVMLTACKAFLTWMQMKKKAYAGFTAGPLKSERLQDYNYTLDNAGSVAGLSMALPPEAEEELEPFVHYGIQVI